MSKPPLDPRVEDFVASKSGLSVKTTRAYRQSMMAYVRWHGSADIDAHLYDRFILSLVEGGRRKNGIALKATVLRDYARYIGVDSAKWQVPRKQKVPRDHLTLEEIETLRRAIPEMKRPADMAFLLNFLLGTGLRITEFLKLKWCDIDIEENIVTVREGKGAKTREVVMLQDARDAALLYFPTIYGSSMSLPELHLTDDFVFPTRNVFTAERYLSRMADAAGLAVRRIHPHLLRHTYATLTQQLGIMSLVDLQENLGHESLQTTSLYLEGNRTVRAKEFSKVSLSGKKEVERN